jgi:hypothetical protein
VKDVSGAIQDQLVMTVPPVILKDATVWTEMTLVKEVLMVPEISLLTERLSTKM